MLEKEYVTSQSDFDKNDQFVGMREPELNMYNKNYDEMFQKEINTRELSLIDNEKYIGVISGVYYDQRLWCKISIEVELTVEGKKARITSEFLFGGDYDEFNMRRLVDMLSTVDNSKELFKTINTTTVEDMARSIKIIEGIPVTVISKTSSKGNKYYILELLGKYNKEKNCIEG